MVCAIALALLLAAPPLPAQSPEDAAPALLHDVFTYLRDEAISTPDVPTLLRAAVAAVQQARVGFGTPDPPVPPVLTGREDEDLRLVSAYVLAGMRATPGRGELVLASVLRAMVRVVGDPLGAVFTPAELNRYLADLRGEHATIGIQVDGIDGAIVVVEVADGSSAARGGIRIGDRILLVDATPVTGRSPDYALALLRGRPGSVALVSLRRPSGQELHLSIPREQVREVPVRARLVEPRVGYLRLLEFTERSHDDMERWLSRLTNQGAQALVFDLRENGGGLVEEAMSVASVFLPSGLVAREERRGNVIVPMRVRDVRERFTGPVVVLVNEGSASASEIVAGALQDERMTLVGARTYGKGSVQTVYSLDAGWGLRITTARYRTRAGRAIEGVGLTPDVPVVMPAGQVQGPSDSQLEVARFLARRRLDTTGQTATGRP